MMQSSNVKKISLCFVLSLVASFFVLLNGIVWFLLGGFWTIMYEGMVFVFGLVFWILGVITIVCAVAIFAGAVVIYLYETRTIGGKIVLVFSVLSMGTGGGLFIGFVLGVLGGYFNITKKQSLL